MYDSSTWADIGLVFSNYARFSHKKCVFNVYLGEDGSLFAAFCRIPVQHATKDHNPNEV
jgi:hypothetical protein